MNANLSTFAERIRKQMRRGITPRRRFALSSLLGKVWGLHACASTSSHIHPQPFRESSSCVFMRRMGKEGLREGGRLAYKRKTEVAKSCRSRRKPLKSSKL